MVSGRDVRLISSEPAWPGCPAGIDPESEAFLVLWTLHVCRWTRTERLIDFTSAWPDAERRRLYTTVVLVHASWLNLRGFTGKSRSNGPIVWRYRFLISWREEAHTRKKFVVEKTQLDFCSEAMAPRWPRSFFCLNMASADASVASVLCQFQCVDWNKKVWQKKDYRVILFYFFAKNKIIKSLPRLFWADD